VCEPLKMYDLHMFLHIDTYQILFIGQTAFVYELAYVTHAKTHTHTKTRAQQRKHETHVNIKNKVTNKNVNAFTQTIYTYIQSIFRKNYENSLKTVCGGTQTV
jgi:hypothetical protein